MNLFRRRHLDIIPHLLFSNSSGFGYNAIANFYSKRILENINNDLLTKLNINQWGDTSQVIDWFKKLEYKSKSKFIQLDIKEYYPSITEETLDKAISFASNHTTVSLEDIRIIKQSRKSLLFHL